jgi:drug/metabolite transporter (DMT)-like permease
MLNTRTLLFGLLFGTLDAVSLPTIKAVSNGMLGFGWMVVPFLLYAASPFLFLEGLKGETLTILNLIWDLTSDLIITLIGFFYFHESLSYTKGLGVLFSFMALFLLSYESEPLEHLLGGGMRRLASAFKST